LLALAVFGDIGAILVVAVAYSETFNGIAVGLAILGLSLVVIIARFGIRSLAIYFMIGIGIWLAFEASGVHAMLTGVILGLMTPAHSWVSDNRLRAILDRVALVRGALTGAAIQQPGAISDGQESRPERLYRRSNVSRFFFILG
jgi:NhaA family Na+:H+ antiporter